jgi:hypothetical protein
MVSKISSAQKRWFTKFKQKVVSHQFIWIQCSVIVSIVAFEMNLDVTKSYAFPTASLDKHRHFFGWKKKNKIKGTYKSLNRWQHYNNPFAKKDGDIRYLTPLNIETNKKKSIVVSKKIWYQIYRLQDADFLLKFVNEQGKFLVV